MRTFIAIPLPEECRKVLGEMQRQLRSTGAEVRWVAVSSIHLTLKFLGEIDPELLPELTEALRAASSGAKAFALSVRGLGAFPNLRGPRVVWCGVECAGDALIELQRSVDQACTGLGFAPEDRPFHPHLTLGRVQGKRNLQRLQDFIKIGSPLEYSFDVGSYNIYKSTLARSGAIYEILDRIGLGNTGTGVPQEG